MGLEFCIEKIAGGVSTLKELAKEMLKENGYQEGTSLRDVPRQNLSDAQLDRPIVKVVKEVGRCPIDGNGGNWSGERGNSKWCPDKETVPGDRNGTNPHNKTWGQILKENKIDNIPFKDGEPDFSKVSAGTVKIDHFSEDRDSNFMQADEKLAEKKKCSPEEIESWRKQNKYTWHECKDCQTMQLVPTEVHGNISHSGGISEIKAKQALENNK